MRLVIKFGYVEVLSIEFSLPRLGIFAPDNLPESIEAIETWGEDE